MRGKRTGVSVAKDLGISKQLLHSYETGVSIPGDAMKQRIAEYYGLTVGALFYGEGQIYLNRVKTNGKG